MNPLARTAIVMPICNEDVATVFAGLRATCESVAATGHAPRFRRVRAVRHAASPEIAAAERAAWEELRAALAEHPDQPQIEVYYRLRARRTHRKAGNVADFCRRWGKDYRYMVVLDADSVMSGDCIASLVKLMEAHPRAGIIQTATQAVGHATLHARAQQFASRVTGRLFTLGMQFWQLGESHYWGHNAIIRVEPFMRHCALAPIAGQRRHGRRHHVARLRRGGADAPRRLPGVAGVRPGRQLRAAAARPAVGAAARPPLVPGQPAELAPDRRARLASGAPRDVRHRRHVLPVGAAVAGLHDFRHRAVDDGRRRSRRTGAPCPSELRGLWAWTLCMLFMPRVLGLAAVFLRREQAQLRRHGRAAAQRRGSRP